MNTLRSLAQDDHLYIVARASKTLARLTLSLPINLRQDC